MSKLSIDPFVVPGGMTDIVDERGQMVARCRDRETAERIIAALEATEFSAAFWRPVVRDLEHGVLSLQSVQFMAQDFLAELHRRAALAPAQEAASDGG